MQYSRRKFIKTAAVSAAAIPLLEPLSLLAEAAPTATPPTPSPAGEAWQPAKGILTTRWTDKVTPENVWQEYPRPLLVRDRWLNLNGLWDYQITDKNEANIPNDHSGKILVPFGIESPLSGVMKPLLPEQRLWVQRDFSIPADWHGQTVLLHFGAVDWESTVYIDGQSLGSHRGGYDSFSFDVTKHVRAGATHTITVSIWDPTDTQWQLHGKQALHPGGCSYTATSGIWQTAWLEPVPGSHIDKLQAIPDLEKGVLKLTIVARTFPKPMKVRAIVAETGKQVADISGDIGDEIRPEIQRNLVDFFKATSAWVSTDQEIPIPNIKTWSPDSPFLYDLTVHLQDASGTILDTVTSYFGMRSLKIGHDTDGNTRLLLNGQPIMLPGALDQGFWPDGVYLAPTDEALRFDIEWSKKLGLNTVRKHVKIEPQRWYYWADRLGLMVFQDMPTGNCGDPFTDRPSSPEAADQWRAEVAHIIDDKLNHPSIICWDLFNEAFGGFDYASNTAWARTLDSSRLINESSGFPWHGGGNVGDGHGSIDFKDPHRITIISELGPSSVGCSGHQWPHAWSYGSYDEKTGKAMDFLAAHNKDPDHTILPDLTPGAYAWLTQQLQDYYRDFLRDASNSGRSGQFYCQLVDVETECDGLISYDREVPKVDAGKVAEAIRSNMPALVARS